MAKVRVYELAKEYAMPSKDFVTILNAHGVPVKNHMSVLTDLQVSQFKIIYEAEKAQEAELAKQKEKAPVSADKPKAKKPAKKPTESAVQEKAEKTDKQQAQPRTTNKPKKETSPVNNRNERKPETKDNRRSKSDDNKKPTVNRSKDAPHKAADSSFKDKKQKFQNNNAAFPTGEQSGSGKYNGRKTKDKKHDSKYSDGKRGKNNEEPIKLKDHSKKGKTSRSAYKKIKAETKSEKQKNQVFSIPEVLTVGELAEIFDIEATEIIKTLMMAGTMATINQQIDFDTVSLVADELGYSVEELKMEDVVSKMLEEYDEAETGNQEKRPPVVTVMGHVDHGKTSLLDRIRKSNVTAGEAGGITQHIGAYTVKIKNESITFIDTPGHEAFTAMRSRGAMMTDIAVIVVAADDGVMPQTIEAINHSKAAGVPIIVAINKIDKDGANPDRVKQELTEHNVLVEEWGGDVIAVPVSAKKGLNIEELLDNILLVAEMEELTADPKRAARGCVIESQMKKGKGATASLLVQQGTLNVGDSIISGVTYGKVRTMIDDKGRRIKKAGPSTPVEISGLSDLPAAGDDFIVLENEKEARQLAEKRSQMQKDQRQAKNKVSLDDLFSRIQEGQIQDINIIIKADVQGSIEAIAQSLIKLSTDEVRINVIHSAVGAINETDVMLASTSDAIIIGFNVRPDKNAVSAAEAEEVDIRLYRVIYDAIEDVKKAMEGMLAPEYVERVTATAEVRDTFRIPNGSTIAGCYVTDGKLNRNDEVRVIRDGIVVFEGVLASLRRFKDDVKEVQTGFECGLGIERYNDIKIGDVIETFVMDAVAREL